MYKYTYELIFAKKNSNLNFIDSKKYIEEACSNINKGLVFRRDGKKIEVSDWEKEKIILNLYSKESLQNPSRSLSALTRYLTTNYEEYFRDSIYNRTLFSIVLLSQENTIDKMDNTEISDAEMFKAIYDLLHNFTSSSNSETIARAKTIRQMKELILPFLSKQ